MIRDINRFRQINNERAKVQIPHLEAEIKRLFTLSPSDFQKLAVESLKRQDYNESLNIRFEESGTKKVLYEMGEDLYSSEALFGPFRLRLGVNEKWVTQQTKANIAEVIHSQVFENDGYIWVNEIVNWEGGDNFAIRRIHPNLRDTEGSFLSTKTTDIKGNTPYLTELEGVKKDGEVYSTYFFKRKDSNAVAEKLTYATVYKEYNWIIAMGMYLEDIQVYIDSVQEASRILTRRLIVAVCVLMFYFFILAAYILLRIEKWFFQHARLAVLKESNTDPLTGAFNRRMGDMYIREAFNRFHRELISPAFFFFDLDNFKKVNDTFGHDAGDRVLKSVVVQIRQIMRNTDFLFRWGGEEFLLMCFGLDRDSALTLAEKLNKTIAFTPIVIGTTDQVPTCSSSADDCSYINCEKKTLYDQFCVKPNGDKNIHVTISIGITFFYKTDNNPEVAIKRADDAMYQAKADGKNCTRLA